MNLYAIISDDGTQVESVQPMDTDFINNLTDNAPNIKILPVNMIDQPPYTMTTETVTQDGWTITDVDVQPVWVISAITSPDLVIVSAQMNYDSVISENLVDSFTDAISNWGTLTDPDKDALLLQVVKGLNAVLNCKFEVEH